MDILGIDIGGSAVKGAPVDVELGKLVVDRVRVKMPVSSVPEAVADCVVEITQHFKWKGPIGCTFPAVIKNGVMLSAANVDKAWVGFNGQKLFRTKTRCPVYVINDADAAGIAEMEFGAGKGQKGVVFILTFGTGIGSAIFVNGTLVPNAELGHLEMRGRDAEKRAAARVRTEQGLTWKQWAGLVNEYLARIDLLFSPDLIIIGGGISKRYDKFLHYLKSEAEIVPARLFNDAGIVGAALAARAYLDPERWGRVGLGRLFPRNGIAARANERLLQIARERGSEFHRLATDWMNEPEPPCVQELTVQLQALSALPTVDAIPNHRMVYESEVDSNLMRATRQGFNL
jgi:polyphosphate glucokinase